MWPRIGSLAIGLLLMAVPAVFEYDGAAGVLHRILGPVAASAAIVAISEVVRVVRWLEVALGVALALAPWPLEFAPLPGWVSVAAGIALVVLGTRGAGVTTAFGGGWRAVLGGRRGARFVAHRGGRPRR